jgi:ABC-type branched-subunit amino acid transport system permease subunit
MRRHIKNGLNAGIVFGIVLIFLILIGFNVTGAELVGGVIGKLIDPTKPLLFAITYQDLYMLIFFALIGLWAGASGARRAEPDTWGLALLGGVTAGAICGLLVAILAYILGVLNAAGVKLSTYLAQLLPASIDALLLHKSPAQGSLILFADILISGAIGALLARGLGRGAWRVRFAAWWAGRRAQLTDRPALQKLLANRLYRVLLYGLLVLVILWLPQELGPYWNYTAGTVGIYVLLGLGLNIVVGMAGLLDLGYVAFFAIGAYTIALLSAPAPHHLEWNFWVILPIGILLAATAGVLLGIPVLRMRGDYLAIVTLGFGEIIRVLLRSDLLSNFTGGPKGVPEIGGPTLFGRSIGTETGFVYLIILACLLAVFVTTRMMNSRVGRAWVAIREDETVAQAMGINTLFYKLLAFGIGAAFAGLGGVLFASRNQFTGPEDHTLMVSINVLCLVIVGGMGSIPGVIAGAFVLKGLPEVMRQLELYRVLFFGALLVVMMVMRPEGIIPSRRRRLEVHETAAIGPPEQAPVEPVIQEGRI